jgi:flagellum-specific ATP synthase
MPNLDLDALTAAVGRSELYQTTGKLKSCTGLLTCTLPAAVGDRCEIQSLDGRPILCEVIGFADGVAYLVPYDPADNVRPGMTVVRKGSGLTVPVGEGLLGRVVDGLGRPADGLGPIAVTKTSPVHRPPPPAMERARIRQPFVTGQRAIDGLLTCGRGQRLGIFAGSGVGKSTLLGEIAKGADSDVNVIALIGERGREVKPFLEDCLGVEGMRRSVVVVATCEQSPLMRVRACQAAIAMADYFRDAGRNVLFMVDSLTRLAMAQREMSLAMGEPPSARGYTPSVFQLLATVVERLGNAAVGGITAVLTVLVDGDDLDEPIADCVRSLVDGHIVLERRLGERGHYPAINISRSVSRIAPEVTEKAHLVSARKMRAILATYAEVEDLIRIGAYVKGASPQVDRALELMPAVDLFLRQSVGERSSFVETRIALDRITALWPF